MAGKRTRDPRYSKSFGTKPNVGRRYVVDNKVRIQWQEGGRRRSKTIGPNSAEKRREADKLLREILAGLPTPEAAVETAAAPDDQPVVESLRGMVLLLLDAADQVADGIRNAAREIMDDWESPEEETTPEPKKPGPG